VALGRESFSTLAAKRRKIPFPLAPLLRPRETRIMSLKVNRIVGRLTMGRSGKKSCLQKIESKGGEERSGRDKGKARKGAVATAVANPEGATWQDLKLL
jgi:hypothetical protein